MEMIKTQVVCEEIANNIYEIRNLFCKNPASGRVHNDDWVM